MLTKIKKHIERRTNGEMFFIGSTCNKPSSIKGIAFSCRNTTSTKLWFEVLSSKQVIHCLFPNNASKYNSEEWQRSGAEAYPCKKKFIEGHGLITRFSVCS